MNLENKLLSLGLTDKEVSVYLAMLYLGPSTAQDIAIRAGVNRATTYVMIEALVGKNMASQITKDKKTVFQAEDPIQILRVLEAQKQEVEEKMGAARQFIPDLQELYNLNRSKINVRLIEGREAMKIVQNDIARSKGKTFDNIVNLSSAVEKFPVNEDDHRRIYYKEKFKMRTIFTYDPKKPVPQMNFVAKENRRLLSQEKFPIFGEVVIYDNKIAFSQWDDKIYTVLIEDANVAKTFKTIFDLAWLSAEKFEITPKEEN
jgi:sugar-specific transcriptional regulator TrmB